MLNSWSCSSNRNFFRWNFHRSSHSASPFFSCSWVVLPQKGEQCKTKILSVYQSTKIFVHYQSGFSLMLCVSAKQTSYYSPFVEYKKTFSLHVESLKILFLVVVFRSQCEQHTNHKIHAMRVLKKFERYFIKHICLCFVHQHGHFLFLFHLDTFVALFRRKPNFQPSSYCLYFNRSYGIIYNKRWIQIKRLRFLFAWREAFTILMRCSAKTEPIYGMIESVWVCWENRTQTSVADTF